MLDEWGARGPESTKVQAGSDLDADDQATDPVHLSHAAMSAMSHGHDHLHCLRTLMVEAESLHIYAPFSLLRSALENYATALWLLQPDDHATRVRRRLQVAAADARRGEEVRAMLSAPVTRPLEQRLGQFADRAEAVGVPRDTVLGKTPSFERIIREAASSTVFQPETLLVLWKTASGVTHGQMWATLGALSRKVTREAEGAVVHVELSAPEESLILMYQAVMLLGRRAWWQFDHRRLKFREHGRDPSGGL
jgi:hypothetical protein